MGDNTTLATIKMALVLLALCLGGFAQQKTPLDQGRGRMPQTAQEYLASFARGEDFTPPARGVFSQGVPDPEAVGLLGQHLATDTPRVREEIVHLLVAMARQTDPLTPNGADVIRDPHILNLLAGPGLSKRDLGREAAMDALRKLAMPSDLHRLGKTFTENLRKAPSEDAFLLVAKAKPEHAKSTVDDLAQTPQWRGNEAARIARAALGDAALESNFLTEASKAESHADGEALCRALGSLALIGTPKTLKAIAERLRTPLTTEVPHAFVRSVRLSVLEALLYNYPEEPVLYPNNIVIEANYEAAERFCEKVLGVAYKTSPPPFLTIRGYPIHVPF